MPKTRKYGSYEEPKPLDKEMTTKEQEFIVQLVDNHKEPEQAFHLAGYKAEGSHAGHRAKRLQRHLWLHIENRIKEKSWRNSDTGFVCPGAFDEGSGI